MRFSRHVVLSSRSVAPGALWLPEGRSKSVNTPGLVSWRSTPLGGPPADSPSGAWTWGRLPPRRRAGGHSGTAQPVSLFGPALRVGVRIARGNDGERSAGEGKSSTHGAAVR